MICVKVEKLPIAEGNIRAMDITYFLSEAYGVLCIILNEWLISFH